MGNKRNRIKRHARTSKTKRVDAHNDIDKVRDDKNKIKNEKAIKALLTGMLRNIVRVEILLSNWVQAFPAARNIPETIFQFLLRIMCSPACLRIENQCLVFLKCSEFRIYTKELTPHENFLLSHITDNWHDFFGKKIHMNYTSISPSYIDCLFDHVLEDAFPRTEIACRYIAILLRINGRGETPGELGPYYERIWMYLYKAILSLYTRGHVSNITRIKPLLDILMKPASVVCVTWDPEKTVHP